MSNEPSATPVAISIEDLAEIVGGVTFKVNPLVETTVPEPIIVALPNGPGGGCPIPGHGGPLHTCMCPSQFA